LTGDDGGIGSGLHHCEINCAYCATAHSDGIALVLLLLASVYVLLLASIWHPAICGAGEKLNQTGAGAQSLYRAAASRHLPTWSEQQQVLLCPLCWSWIAGLTTPNGTHLFYMKVLQGRIMCCTAVCVPGGMAPPTLLLDVTTHAGGSAQCSGSAVLPSAHLTRPPTPAAGAQDFMRASCQRKDGCCGMDSSCGFKPA
jgi:hypothetical protein